MAYSQLRANIRNAMVPMTIAEATTFAASFDDAESRGYAEEFLNCKHCGRSGCIGRIENVDW